MTLHCNTHKEAVMFALLLAEQSTADAYIEHPAVKYHRGTAYHAYLRLRRQTPLHRVSPA